MKVKKVVKPKKVKAPKKKTDSQLKKELDKVFSIYIRQKYADKNGNVKCVTCGVIRPWQEMQNGHYISRGYLATRFSEDNCFVQCVSCNVFRNGNYPAYALFLINKFGKDHLDMLEREKNKITKYYDYQGKIDYYKSKIQ